MSSARLSVLTTWQEASPSTIAGRVVVVIDVLRWSTVVLTALDNGAERVEAFATPAEALARAAELGRERVLLGGERESLPLPGFDVGNSPREYSRVRVEGRVVLTTTTNGTQALIAARRADEVLVGAFVNLNALVERLARALRSSGSVTLLCAGQAGEETLEDTACAGAVVEALLRSDTLAVADCDEPSLRARALWQQNAHSAPQVMAHSPHAAALKAAGYAADVLAAAHQSSQAQVGRVGSGGAIFAH